MTLDLSATPPARVPRPGNSDAGLDGDVVLLLAPPTSNGDCSGLASASSSRSPLFSHSDLCPSVNPPISVRSSGDTGTVLFFWCRTGMRPQSRRKHAQVQGRHNLASSTALFLSHYPIPTPHARHLCMPYPRITATSSYHSGITWCARCCLANIES